MAAASGNPQLTRHGHPVWQVNRNEVERYTAMYEDLKRELQIIQASAAAV